MRKIHRVALLGFSDFERLALAACFGLVSGRQLRYEQVKDPSEADCMVADADHGPAVQLVEAAERLAETVFIGAHAPAGSKAWMARPIDPPQVLRELDALVAGPAAPPPAACPPVAVTLPVPSAAPPLTLPAPPPSRPSALLVDDSAIATRYLESRLVRWGLDIERAGNSQEALVLLERQDFDFVFLDVELGEQSELDGLALCQYIRRDGHRNAAIRSTVVMVSVHQGELDRVRGALAGCDAYLGKPLDEVDLHRLMMRHGLRAVTAPAAPSA